MEVIYIDSLFLLNLIIDYLLCLVSARICGLWLKRNRYLLAALIGAAYSVLVFLPGLDILAQRWGKLACATLMGAVAYGKERQRLKCTAVFLAVSAAFGGAVWALSMAGGIRYESRAYMPFSMRALVLAFALCYAGTELLFKAQAKLPERPRSEVELRFMGKVSRFMALCDSGNTLTDPISGAEVMIVSPHALQEALGDETNIFCNDDAVGQLQKLNSIPALRGKFRLVPYSSLGGSGMLAVFRPDMLLINGIEEKELLVAVSPAAAGEGFDAIV